MKYINAFSLIRGDGGDRACYAQTAQRIDIGATTVKHPQWFVVKAS